MRSNQDERERSKPLHRSWWRRTVILTGAIGALALLAGVAVVESGWYDVGATTPHAAVVEKLLHRTMVQSVRHHARDIQVPTGVDLADPALAERAVGHYSIVCAACHAAPGEPRAAWMALYPPAPDLTRPETIDTWSDSELFWIIKNGIKDTGMVALPPGHGDEDAWAVAAFVRQLPGISPSTYQTQVAAYQAGQAAHGTHAGHGH